MGSQPGTIYLNHGRYWYRVRLPGEAKRRAFPLRPEGARYATSDPGVAEVLAECIWLQATLDAHEPITEDGSVAALCQAYMQHAQGYYRSPEGEPTGEETNIRCALAPLVHLYATDDAADLSPVRLKAVRRRMVEDGLARTTINKRIGIIRRMYKWAVAEGRVPSLVYQGLCAVDGLRAGRSDARETDPVSPVAEHHVRAVLPHCSPVVAAMIELQLLTGMRSGSLVAMRPEDLDCWGEVWVYEPQRHKTAHRGKEQYLCLGPRCQGILIPFLDRPLARPCFSPREAEEWRRARLAQARTTPANVGNRAGTNRRGNPAWRPGEAYTTSSYGKAVRRAIISAQGEHPSIPYWHPHQMRHTVATRVRREMGIEAAGAYLGHADLDSTEIYAERSRTLAAEAARRFG